jgi:chromate transporter
VITLTLGLTSIWSQLARFFSQAAVVTFGGAYSVLAYIAQEAVETHAWLEPGEMLTGLGMAETTPGPLIQVVQYVGFMGAYREPGGLDPLLAGVLAALLVTWVTFAPCFLWIFLGAPYMERLRNARMLNAALSMVTAAVVGTVLNLAVWFALHTLFADVQDHRELGLRFLIPEANSLDLAALVISAVAALALFRFRVSVMRILIAAAFAGVAYEVTLA